VESESIFNFDYYDPTSIPKSSNPVMAEEEPTLELGSSDHPVFRYKMWMWMWMWMWMRMMKRNSDTWMSRMMTSRMQQI
jgi:hypothetical protein